MSKRVLAVAAFAAMMLTSIVGASADEVTGAFSITGSFQWVNNGTCVSPASCPSILLGSGANAVDFRSGGTPSPGVAGPTSIEQVVGGLAAFLAPGDAGTIRDFTYTGAGTVDFPTTPPDIIGFEAFSTNNIAVDLTGITQVVTICAVGCNIDTDDPGIFQNAFPTLSIQGTINIRSTVGAFDVTDGVFSFLGQNNGGAFSFRAGQVATPEPSTLLLLGFGLAGFGIGGRLIRRK